MYAGIYVGTYIRESAWNSTYGGMDRGSSSAFQYDNCASSCSSVVLGGVTRFSNSRKFLVHQPAVIKTTGKKCVSSDDKDLSVLKDYLDFAIGSLSNEFFNFEMTTPCNQLATLPTELAGKIFR